MENKNGFCSVYADFWKKGFDYKTTSNLREYWLPVSLHAGLLIVALVYYLLFHEKGASLLPFWIVLGFLFLTLPPFVALTVRRLRDTGLSGIWALLLLFVGAGTCVVLALCAAGSGFNPGVNIAPNLYGPPPWESSSDYETSQTESISENETETIIVSTENTGTETTADLTLETVEATENPEAESLTLSPEQDMDFLPSENIPEPLYGPPPTEPAQNE